MPRIRTIKPDFFTSEDVVALSPPARLLFIALWCEADREGRLEWRPGTIKLRYFPGDDIDVDALSKEMVSRGMLVRYSVDGREYAVLPGFVRHQVVNNREAASSIPEPRVTHASGTRHARVGTPLVGKERKGRKEHASRDASRETRFARFWEAYPKKVAKTDALKAWHKLDPDDRLTECIIAAVGRAAATDAWRKDRGQYVPNAATYLNGRRFDDELVPVVTERPAPRNIRPSM